MKGLLRIVGSIANKFSINRTEASVQNVSVYEQITEQKKTDDAPKMSSEAKQTQIFFEPKVNSPEKPKTRLKTEQTYKSTAVLPLVERLKLVDLARPPGIAGEICEDLSRFERRSLVALRPACALGVLSLLGHKSVTYSGEKMTFYALCVALSAGGKEAHLRYFRSMCEGCGMSSSLCAEPRSDKQVMQDLVESNPAVYILDEAHKFFGAALDPKSANTYMSAVGDLLLELKTTNLFKVPRSVKSGYGTDIRKTITQLENKGSLTTEEHTLLENQKKLLTFFEDGIKNPQLWVIGYSTPSKSAFFVNEDTINSGFIGRVYLFPGEENRTPMDFNVTRMKRPATEIADELLPRFQMIMKSGVEISLRKESEGLFQEIFDYFEADHHLNHEHLGSLYARGIEHVINIASILALETRVIDDDMLLYGAKLYLNSIKAANAELSVKIADSNDQLRKSANKVVKRVTADGPKHLGLLANHFEKCNAHVRKLRKAGNERAHYVQLEKLISSGRLVEQDGKFIHSDHL